ncbi:hypothetical protein F4604DRAFT_1933664 [Suillus subluteus]|nr:hypothetical protein F4604DRAFT_1933664 [Suillus subluteus]
MGPGSRRDMLDDHFGDWNWKKLVGLGATLLRKMDEAKDEHEAHTSAFEELNGALESEITVAWRAEVEHWEENPNDLYVPNPFDAKVSTITQAAVQLKLAEMEARQLQDGTDMSLHLDISPSVFIAIGIDLESEQRRFKSDIALRGAHPTDRQNTAVVRQQNTLWRKSANTHTQNAISQVEARVTSAAEKYRVAHAALSALAPVLSKVGWNVRFRSLNKKDDVRGMSAPKKGESEGRRQLSWIWLVEGVGDDKDKVVQDSLRLEWCKARARMMRWKEEIELLWEEMHQVLQFLRWHAHWWDNTVHLHTLTGTEREGVVVYAT